MDMPMFPDLVINGEVVPQSAVAAELQNHTASRDNFADALRKAANALVVRMLLLQEARKRDLQTEPQEVGPNRFETDDEALIRALLENVVSVVAPTEADIRIEWGKNPSRFRTPPLWEVSHILCKCDPSSPDESCQALARAQAIATQLAKNPSSFAKLAERESDCGSRASAGSLGQLRPGDTVPEFEAALRTLNDGEITVDPILTRHGYHVIRMDALAEGDVLPFDAVKSKISDAMEKTAWAREAKVFIDGLVASAEISGTDMRPH